MTESEIQEVSTKFQIYAAVMC